MAGRVHEKATCPLCKWESRSFKLPVHLIEEHPAEIIISKVMGEHCLYASVIDNGEEKSFCVCLTCKRGVYHGPMDRQGARWIAIHAKETACKTAHREAITIFRQKYYTPTEPKSDMVTVLWEECRSDKRMRPMVDEIQKYCVEMDGRFEASEGFKQVVRSAVGFKKDISKSQAQINQMVADHERELVQMRIEMAQQRREIEALRSTLLIKGDEMDAMCLRLADAEEQLAQVTEAKVIVHNGT